MNNKISGKDITLFAYLKYSVRIWWAERPFPINVSEEERDNIIRGRLQKILDELESIEDNINE